MQIDKEALWTLMKKKAQEEDAIPENTQKVEHAYIAGVQSICEYAVGRASRIQNNFPMFTLHDETHICNVMRIMMQLLGNLAETLSRDEAAMLILAACCHDIGMSYSPEADGDLSEDTDRLNRYFDEHRGEYVKAYSGGGDHPKMTDSMIQRFLRCIHHERCADLLYAIEWPAVLNGKVERGDLVRVCQSHGEDAELLNNLAPTTTVDLRLCAILLRLADILDFDTSRAPSAVYDYCGFDKLEAPEALISREQWQIHRSSHGFDFIHIHDRSIPYELPYHATSKSMQIEQTVNTYLDWVDQELILCGKQLSSLSPRWQKLILPVKIQRQITPDGYLSGQYRLTLDQEQVLDLLVGRDLYSDPAVFVRELIQNAIDAVRTRKELDKNLPNNWKPQIKIHTWMDEEGYHWFRIEDNGTGMSEEIIRNHLLKIGSSYYKSDLFEQEKLRCKADPNYQPISRFGIGILSCFMSDKEHNRVEISTKRFRDGSDYPPALRLSMQGMNGYYYMASKEKNHHPGPMIGRTPAEQKEYLSDAGTVVAVRTDLNSSGKYRGFKEIVDRYVVFPPVDIHYEGEEDSLDYTTEETFIKTIKEIQRSEDPAKSGLFEQSLSDEQLEDIRREYPGIDLSKPPKALLKCAALDRYTASPNLTGALLTATVMNQIPRFSHHFEALKLDMAASVTINYNENAQKLEMDISFSPSDYGQKRRLDELGERYKSYESRNWYYLLRAQFSEDDCKTEILSAIQGKYIEEPSWKQYMQDRFHLSPAVLTRKIREVKQILSELLHMTEEEQKIALAYRSQRNKWSFPLWDLSTFAWFRDCFQVVQEHTGYSILAAHNGIACGSADFFCNNGGDDQRNISAVMLLKDSYRPELDIARDRVRTLPLETACDLASIRRKFNTAGFGVKAAPDVAANEGYSSLPLKSFWKLLDRRPDLADSLAVPTRSGTFPASILLDKLRKHTSLELSDQKPFYTIWLSEKRGPDWCLRMAYLQQNYTLRIDIRNSYSSNIYVYEKQPDDRADRWGGFPVCFFLSPVRADCPYLATGDPDYRRACNAEHRLSRFILQNAELLRKNASGILREMLRCLAKEAGEALITKVNALLKQIRKLPKGEIEVPDMLLLTKDDLA